MAAALDMEQARQNDTPGQENIRTGCEGCMKGQTNQTETVRRLLKSDFHLRPLSGRLFFNPVERPAYWIRVCAVL